MLCQLQAEICGFRWDDHIPHFRRCARRMKEAERAGEPQIATFLLAPSGDETQMSKKTMGVGFPEKTPPFSSGISWLTRFDDTGGYCTNMIRAEGLTPWPISGIFWF